MDKEISASRQDSVRHLGVRQALMQVNAHFLRQRTLVLRQSSLLACLGLILSGCSTPTNYLLSTNTATLIRDQKLIIPRAGIRIEAPVYLDGEVHIEGEGPLLLSGEGRLIVQRGSNVSLRHLEIHASDIQATDDETPVTLIKVLEGAKTRLAFEHNKFFADIPYKQSEGESPWDHPPVTGSSGMMRQTGSTSLKLRSY